MLSFGLGLPIELCTHGSLLYDDALDVEILKLQILGIRVRLSVLEKTSDELDRLLRPATYESRVFRSTTTKAIELRRAAYLVSP